MLRLEDTSTAGIQDLLITGPVTESTEFQIEIAPTTRELHVNCREIPRINSMGITKWILFFRDLREKGIRLKFLEVAVPVVNICNFVAGMVGKDEVESFFLPYFCEACSEEFERLVQVSDLRANNFQVESVPCEKCGATAEFDGVAGHYFDFLAN